MHITKKREINYNIKFNYQEGRAEQHEMILVLKLEFVEIELAKTSPNQNHEFQRQV